MSLMLNSNSDDETLYSDSVFSTYLYTGNGSTQTITNGVDLAGKGGLVWIKSRSAATTNHRIFDTNRGVGNSISSNLTTAQSFATSSLDGFLSSGFSIQGFNGEINDSARTYASWTFRKAAKFFDVVTYTGNGTLLTVNHNLGVAPGMIIVKRLDGVGDWNVYHRSLTASNYYLLLNTTGAQQNGSNTWGAAPTSTTFTVGNASGGDNGVNASGGTYVAYLYAHDTSSTGIIQCGSFTTDGSGKVPAINLGWSPQYILFKKIDSTSEWWVVDTMRGWTVSDTTCQISLSPNYANAENSLNVFSPTATGFATVNVGGSLPASSTYIYMAIRRPNKPPTTGTQVYNAIARTGTGAAATVTGVGFPPDLIIPFSKDAANRFVFDRLRGNSKGLKLGDTQVEYDSSSSAPVNFEQNGFSCSTDSFNICNTSTAPFINWFFKRAPGFFDEVCYTGTGVNRTVAHNLTVAPEFIIIKARNSAAYDWIVYPNDPTTYLKLNLTNVLSVGSTVWNNTASTTSVFSLGTSIAVNESAITYVAYLFATLAGISKVGSYTGNGTSQNIECGFVAGARFVMVKRTDSTGDWYVWDTTRGIVSANDPHLSLNTTAAEVTTDDSVDPYSAGFAVNQVAATNINVTSATYIFLAIS